MVLPKTKNTKNRKGQRQRSEIPETPTPMDNNQDDSDSSNLSDAPEIIEAPTHDKMIAELLDKNEIPVNNIAAYVPKKLVDYVNACTVSLPRPHIRVGIQSLTMEQSEDDYVARLELVIGCLYYHIQFYSDSMVNAFCRLFNHKHAPQNVRTKFKTRVKAISESVLNYHKRLAEAYIKSDPDGQEYFKIATACRLKKQTVKPPPSDLTDFVAEFDDTTIKTLWSSISGLVSPKHWEEGADLLAIGFDSFLRTDHWLWVFKSPMADLVAMWQRL